MSTLLNRCKFIGALARKGYVKIREYSKRNSEKAIALALGIIFVTWLGISFVAEKFSSAQEYSFCRDNISEIRSSYYSSKSTWEDLMGSDYTGTVSDELRDRSYKLTDKLNDMLRRCDKVLNLD